jgi:SAM-dependent methyltransferase
MFDDWLKKLETRHLADLQFPEVTRALRALSSAYVERRGRLQEGAALDGAGKRAAFALYYGPLHYLIVREVVRSLEANLDGHITLVDLGCGTGAAGAAWGSSGQRPRDVVGIDRHPWALDEAARTYREFDLKGRTRQGDFTVTAWPEGRAAIVGAFAVNELPAAARNRLLERLLDRGKRDAAVLIVEPLARFVAPWWKEWSAAFEQLHGRSDEWRFRIELPPMVAKLDRAAGLDHRELTARSLWVRRSG